MAKTDHLQREHDKLHAGLVRVAALLRDIPRWIPIHRLIWRRFYAEQTARRP